MHQNLAEMLAEPSVESLARETLREYIDWDQLTERALPPGLSVAETWQFLGRLRYLSGTANPIPTAQGEEYWYSLNQEGGHCLEYIRRYTRAESVLHRALKQREGHRLVVEARVRETLASCRLSGIQLDYPRLERVLRGRKVPRGDGERLALNVYEMLEELDTWRPEPFTPELVQATYDRLVRGVDLRLVARQAERTLLRPAAPGGSRVSAGAPPVLDAICDYANRTTGDPYEPAAIKAYMVMATTAYWKPLPELNSLVGRHLMRIYSVMRDYPVLACLPLSPITHRWLVGDLPPGTTRYTAVRQRPVVPGTADGTEEVLTYLQLTTAAVAELIGCVDTAKREEAILDAMVPGADGLNYRQRAVLATALTHPGTHFTIRPHQVAHGVVYQTARADLLDLAEKGYMRQQQHGKAFVFVAGERLGV